MLTDDQVADIERRAQEWADTLSLPDEAAFSAAVESQLARLVDPPIGKRRATALALAQVGITEATRREVMRRPGIVSYRIFYSRQKDWYYGETFRDVLERLIRLYRRWSAGQAARAAADDFRERVGKLREMEADIGEQMFGRVLKMLEAPLYEVTATGVDGKDVTLKPARWTVADIPRVAESASKLLRLSLDMAPGGRKEVALDWAAHLPEGITPAQAEAAKETWARLLAAADEEGDEDDDEDEE